MIIIYLVLIEMKGKILILRLDLLKTKQIRKNNFKKLKKN